MALASQSPDAMWPSDPRPPADALWPSVSSSSSTLDPAECSLSSSGRTSSSSSSLASPSADGSRRLRRLSVHARRAVWLNQVQRVQVARAVERASDGATVYVLDVYLHRGQKGLPPPVGFRPALPPPKPGVYQVEYRYSELRALRDQLRDVVDNRADPMHAKWCAYCSRVAWLADYGGFPSRLPNGGALAVHSGWRALLVRHRRKHLDEFLNRLLRASKDASYRVDALHCPCSNFTAVSDLLNRFFAEPGAPPPPVEEV